MLLRVPGWAPRESLKLTVGGADVPLEWVGPRLLVRREVVAPGVEIVLTHALPERTTTESPGGKREYRLHWRGDEVVGSEPPTQLYGG